MSAACHSSFEHLRTQTLDALNITISEYRHRHTSAQHIHLQTDSEENVFLVALRTVPDDSTGVAHILEHTALCGSDKYPVRDPFFMMIRRSLNTFMNAFTSSDWTAYPFASQNAKDFDNLLNVYLDAVFFSRLDPLDFAQEGHRLDFAETGNPDSPLVYKGVVFNEMKGAMSAVSSQLWQTLSKYLYPTTTYHHNSGGDPQAIPDLSYEQLQQFYQSHYHPSNAIFMTFGNITAEDHQEKFHDRALQHFDPLDEMITVEAEKRYVAPIRVEEAYPYQPEPGESAENKAHIVMAWLLGPSIDLTANLEVHLLSSLLFDNSASPLQHLLETTELGASPSPLCGMDDSQYEMLFMCGIADTQVEHSKALEEQVLSTLQKVAEKGLPQEEVEASLHQLELRQREIGGDGYPYGLQLILNALSAATHRGDVLAFMDLDAAIEQLRQAIQSPDYIPKLVTKLLLNNQHRVTLTLRPDSDYHQRQVDAEQQALAQIKAKLSENDKRDIIEQAAALDARQQQKDDDSILPKVTLEDIPQQVHYPEEQQHNMGQHPLTSYCAGTNGLSYQQLVTPLPTFKTELIKLLPLYSLCQTELGLGHKTYLDVQKRQSAVVGSINNFFTLRMHPDDPQQLFSYTTLSAKALNRNQRAMSDLMRDTVEQLRFDEDQRILDLVTQTRIGREQSITSNGHIYAMKAAAAHFNPTAYFNHQLSGLASVQAIKDIEQQLQNGDNKQLTTQLETIHQGLIGSDKHWLAVTESAHMDSFIQSMRDAWQAQINSPSNASRFTPESSPIVFSNQAWITNSQVHFCAQAYPTVTMTHPDAAALSVLGGVLRNGFLHRAIREQGGAYGGGASQDSSSASFRFYSYRDPRLTETLDDFKRATQWLFDEPITEQSIEESILGCISAIDKPGSPAGEAKQEFHASFTGRTRELREQYRQRIIGVTAKDLLRVAESYLVTDKASTVVVTGNHGLKEAEQQGFDIITI